MVTKKKNFREEMADIFIKCLEEEPIKWFKSWNFSKTGRPINEKTHKEYQGINLFYLKLMENENGYGDNRFMTYKQANDMGYKIKKGAKGDKIEYPALFDKKEKKFITWDKYEEIKAEMEAKMARGEEIPRKECNRFKIRSKISTVFNAIYIDGLEKIERDYVKNDINEEKVLEDIVNGLKVNIKEVDNSKSAYYQGGTSDTVHIPKKEQFKSQGAYTALVLHELAHATGHPSRCNRHAKNKSIFGNNEYAYEELVAEITSAFLSEYVKEPMTDEVINNHKAYIQSWCKMVRKDKTILHKAIKEAQEASDYIVKECKLEKYLENNISVELDELEEEYEI